MKIKQQISIHRQWSALKTNSSNNHTMRYIARGIDKKRVEKFGFLKYMNDYVIL